MDKVKKLSIETPFTEADIASSLAFRAKQGLPLDLQFFADGGEGTGQGADGGEGGQQGEQGDGEGGEGNEKTFTQSEVDRKISKAVAAFEENQKPKQQEAINQAVKDALAEHQRLSKLSEKEQQEEQMTKREKEIAEREAKIQRAELRSEAIEDLHKKELPSKFADFLLSDDAESTLENINTFKQAFDEAVNAAVKEKLRQDTPPAGGGGNRINNNKSKAEMAKKARII